MGHEDHEVLLKHVCKFCNKSFHCGRSLGGHMRSHMVNTTDGETSRKKLPALIINTNNNNNNVNLDMGNQSVNYTLRENPKKTLKFSEDLNDTLLPKVCKECGKSFQSWKALFGHMKCHSSSSQEEDSWNSGSESDTEAAATAAAKAPKKKKRSSRRRMISSSSLTVAANYALSPCVSEIEHEQEEIAMSLILLSRDVGNWVGHNHVTDQCSDNNSQFLQSKLMSNSNTKSELIKKVKYGKTEQGESSSKSPTNGEKRGKSEVPVLENEKKKKIKVDNELDSDLKENSNKIKFECTTCNKRFHSYQALGGHRASHKNTKGESCSNIDIKNRGGNESEINEFGHNCGSKKQLKMHECPICYKIFPSGQALGGHKRSHLIAEAKKNINNINQTVEVQKPIPEIRNFLDLNLPAPIEEEENILDSSSTEQHIEFQQWWIDSRHKHEQLLGLLSN